MKALVTGAAGFIGSHLCELLIKEGHEVIGIDDLSNGRSSNIPEGTRFRVMDIRTYPAYWPAADIDCIFHLAAKADIVPSIEKPIDYHETNVNGTIALLEFARKANVKKFIYAASSSCYGDLPNNYPTPETDPCNPQYPYALTKYIGEQYVMHWSKVYKIPAVSLRLFNVYGPKHRTSGAYGAVFGVFLAQLANNKPVTIVGDGTQKRDFTYVIDVCEAFLWAAETNIQGIYNVGSDGSYEINYLAKLLGAKDIQYIPKRPGEPDITFADMSKLNRQTLWYPKVSFEKGVEKMKELIPEYKDAPVWTKESIDDATKTWFKFLGEK